METTMLLELLTTAAAIAQAVGREDHGGGGGASLRLGAHRGNILRRGNVACYLTTAIVGNKGCCVDFSDKIARNHEIRL